MTTIENPVLRGFNPDPSFVRVGEDYYIATSTFEWHPGIAIHHSRDLAHWRLLGHCLSATEQLDLRGVDNSGGIWAPSMSFHDGRFWMVYTIVRTCGKGRPFKDTHNYVVTGENVEGPWSDPIYLHSCGFDPSLFHDVDGRKWIVSVQWDYRKDHPRFAGIVLQEYDPRQKAVVGPLKTILRKEHLIEGPNLYKRGSRYYLMLAEGGTGYNHGIAMARSEDVWGPYELDPQPAVLTTRDNPEWPLQKAGHGELVESPSGEWWLAHLCSRPVGPDRRCILGRETALQRVVWTDDGWLRLADGGVLPAVEVDAPSEHALHPWGGTPDRDDFEAAEPAVFWTSLRRAPEESWLSLSARPGWLRLVGRESPFSLFEQSLVARRLTEHRATAETCMEFEPDHFTQMAGLICWYHTRLFYFLRVTHEEKRGKILGVVLCDDGEYDELHESDIRIGDWERMYMKAAIDGVSLRFYASPTGLEWNAIGPVLDMSRLSDDYGSQLNFTGAFVGLAAYDLNGGRQRADFDYFTLTQDASPVPGAPARTDRSAGGI